MQSKIKLSILICTISERRSLLDLLVSKLKKQIDLENAMSSVEILINAVEGITIGEKRNLLVNEANGLYLCFIDDDDDVSDDYISELLKAVDSNKDCASLKGIITWNGENAEVFEHSIRYKEYKNDLRYQEVRYERYPNHLNCIKSSIAKQIPFTAKNHSEDTDFADLLFQKGLIKSEYQISKILYYYRYGRKK